MSPWNAKSIASASYNKLCEFGWKTFSKAYKWMRQSKSSRNLMMWTVVMPKSKQKRCFAWEWQFSPALPPTKRLNCTSDAEKYWRLITRHAIKELLMSTNAAFPYGKSRSIKPTPIWLPMLRPICNYIHNKWQLKVTWKNIVRADDPPYKTPHNAQLLEILTIGLTILQSKVIPESKQDQILISIWTNK